MQKSTVTRLLIYTILNKIKFVSVLSGTLYFILRGNSHDSYFCD